MTTEKTEIMVQEPASITTGGAFSSAEAFENAQRMANLLAASNLVPDTYKENLPNSVIALEMANRIGANPLAVMQNLYIVHGRPAWSSQFLISCVNASGKFTPLRYLETGNKDSDSWGMIAWAQDASGERLESPEVTIAMAKAEGWFSKKGSKWQTMPGLMLRYRAATFFARLYAPELTMGIQCEEEVKDISQEVDIAPPAQSMDSSQTVARAKAQRLGTDVSETAGNATDVPAEAVPEPEVKDAAPQQKQKKARSNNEIADAAKKRKEQRETNDDGSDGLLEQVAALESQLSAKKCDKIRDAVGIDGGELMQFVDNDTLKTFVSLAKAELGNNKAEE